MRLYLRVHQKLQQHLKNKFPFLNGKRLLIAVSGGVDSMVLAYLMHDLGYEISLAHVNFQLRNEASEADEQFVIGWAKTKKIKVFTVRFDTEKYATEEKLSIQMTARKLRYDWFEGLLKNEGFDFLLTAHHLEDQLETFLINFSRGTGLDGLVGIPEKNESIIRPLLIFSKDEVQDFARQNNISWVEDQSNASDKYLRNNIRHHISPLLKSLHPTFLENFQQTLFNLKQAQSFANVGFEYLLKNLVSIKGEKQICNIEKLLALHDYERFMYYWLQPFGFKAWKDLKQLVFAETGKTVASETYKLLKERDVLVLVPKEQVEDLGIFYIQNIEPKEDLPIKIQFEITTELQISNANTIFVDLKKIVFPLELRKWTTDDFFFPFGMKGKKKVSKFLRDAHVPAHQKSDCWVLCSENKIVWVVGYRADQRFYVEKDACTILKIKLESF